MTKFLINLVRRTVFDTTPRPTGRASSLRLVKAQLTSKRRVSFADQFRFDKIS
jgi:hypothetical protein